MPTNIFDYIKQEEANFAKEIEVMPNWNWCMKDHIINSNLMKHGKFIKASNDLTTKNPKKNVVYPLLNLRYRAEDIDLKDVTLYVNDAERYHLSFLVKKYHDDVYVKEHDLDTFFDATKEEKIDIGGTLVRKGADGPVHEKMDSIAFCDQTDILAGPICFKDFYSPDQLLEMSKAGWGDKNNGADITLEDLVYLAEMWKDQDTRTQSQTQTPGKYIEVYRIHGALPTAWLKDDSTDQKRYTRQMQIVAFYDNEKGMKTGVTLYKKNEYENPFKLHLSGTKIRNRALAFGGVEELLDTQIWTDYSEIRKRDMLDAVSKVITWTDDDTLTNKNKIRDMDNLQMLQVQKGSQVGTVNITAPNIAFFNEWIREWDIIGQTTSGATDTLLGRTESSGTPFRTVALQTQNGMGLHEYRRGKFASFIAEIYRDWIIPDIAKKITQGTKFLATLSSDEMEYVADCLVRSQVHKQDTERVLSGQLPMTEDEEAQLEKQIRDDFARGGNKKFIEILKGEFEDVALSVNVNVAGKQKDLLSIVDRMVNVFRQVFANPAILNDPKAAKVFNKILEYSGLDPIDFGYVSSLPNPNEMQPSPVQPQMQPKMPAMQKQGELPAIPSLA